ncbi:hypothetical protein ACH5RR_021174 [Cinchona calisaya]|uniref:Uncharacterized protein n=1 Tax=Cinchona calisaya TaxID=153742 RepID=A0ABD2ZGI9_9GENT
MSCHVFFWEHKLLFSMFGFHNSSSSSLQLFTNNLINPFPYEISPDTDSVNSFSEFTLVPFRPTNQTMKSSKLSPSQPISPRSTRVRIPPALLIDYHCYSVLLPFMRLNHSVRLVLTLFGRKQ